MRVLGKGRDGGKVRNVPIYAQLRPAVPAEVIQADLARHDAPQEAAERTKGPVDCVKGNRLHKDSAP